MRTRLLVVAAAGLTQECWGKLKGKAQVEWYEHLRKIDETVRADAVMTSTVRSVAQCVANATGSQEPDPSIWPIVDAFVKQRFRVSDT